LLSARISAGIAVAAARGLFGAGCRSQAAMARASWQDRVDALGRGHYRRYDERTAAVLGDAAAQPPSDREYLTGLLAGARHPARLAAALVRVSLSRRLAAEVTAGPDS
jgi:hypothetical protein